MVPAKNLRHDAVAATDFFEWCKKNGLIDRDLLA